VEEWGKFCEKFNGPVHSPEEVDDLYHCGGGISSFAIDPYGVMRVCALSCDDGYVLRRGSFRDGWEGFLLNVRKKKISRQTKCIQCEIKAMCGMCPANAQLENRDAEEPVDYLCHVAHLRAKALGIQIKPHGECEYCET
jgi:radical SAM protein with 4Fe4S-binding SPASM domain